MKPSDILSAVKNADGRFIEESEKENASGYFKSRKLTGILGKTGTVAACLALAAFIGVNIYIANAGKAGPDNASSGDNTPGRVMLTEGTDVIKTKASLTVKTHKRSFTNTKSEKTYDIDEYNLILPSTEYDANAGISYIMNGLTSVKEFENEYVMNKTDDIIKYKDGKEEWTYRIDEGANFYYSQKVSGGVIYEKNDCEIGLIDSKGKLKWKTKTDGYLSTDIYEMGDEIWLWCPIIQEIVCMDEAEPQYEYSPVDFRACVYSAKTGELIKTVSKIIGVYGTNGILSLVGATNDGFVFCSYKGDNIAVITIIGFDGECKKIISFEDENRKYNVTSADIYGDVLYLSGTLTERNKNLHPGRSALFDENSRPLFLEKFGQDYYKDLLNRAVVIEETDAVSFMLAYSLDKNEPVSLYTVNNAFGGRVYFDESADATSLRWDTFTPVYTRKARMSLQSDEGRAHTILFDNELKSYFFTEGGKYAVVWQW